MNPNGKDERRRSKDKELKKQENILYEILVTNEWQEPEVIIKGQDREEISARKTFTSNASPWFRFRPLSFSANITVPNSIERLIDSQLSWQFAVGGDSKTVAILQDQHLEMRSSRDDYATIVGKCAVWKDPFPQWRKLVWSPDCTMIAVGYSTGNIDVFDAVGSKLFSICRTKDYCGTMPANCSDSLADMLFIEHRTKKTQWSAELLVCNFRGQLNSYFVSPTDGFQESYSFFFTSVYPYGVTALCHHPLHQLLFVGGVRMETSDDAQTHVSASHYAITAWRVLTNEPYYKLVTTLEDDKVKHSTPRNFLKYVPTLYFYKKVKEDSVLKLMLSPNGQKLAVIHTSGSLSVWNVPSLQLCRLWRLSEQPGYNEINPSLYEYHAKKRLAQAVKDKLYFHLIDLNWWSDMALILSRCSGSVSIASISSLRNLLGESCEWFEPMPQLSAAQDKGFLALESESVISSKKRSSAEDDDSVDESSDEESHSILDKSSKLMKTALYYMTDSERFQPPRKRMKVLTKTYRLICLKSTTPEELYSRRMDNEEYGEALVLAKAYNLDTDLVYQRQWKKTPVSITSIQDYLSKIKKRFWVLHECTERVSDDIDASRELLLYGLKGTDLEALVAIGKGEDGGKFVVQDDCEDFEDTFDEMYQFDEQTHRMQKLLSQVNFAQMTVEQKQLCTIRRKLLSYLDRLNTYEVMLGGPHMAAEHFDSKFFQTFRNQPVVEATVEFARNSNCQNVGVMFTHHGEESLPHRLSILSNFPETTNPFEYRSLLPEAGYDDEPEILLWEQTEGREQDWCEDIRCTQVIGAAVTEVTLYEDFPELAKFQSEILSKSLVSEWYAERAREIERRTLFVDCSLELVKLGRERYIEGLEYLYDDLLTLETMVYECKVNCTLEDYQSMADIDKIHLLMSTSTMEHYIKNVRRWLIPFLDRFERRSEGRKLELLREYMLAVSEKDLSYCLLISQNSRLESTDAVISSVNEMVDIALCCVYTCARDDQLKVANKILECLPSREFGPTTPEYLKLHDWIDEFEKHVRASFILMQHDIHKPLFYARDCQNNSKELKQLLIKIARNAGKKHDPASKEDQWNKVLRDMLDLQKILGCVSPDLCYEIFVESLLCSNNSAKIGCTERLMECSNQTSGFYGKKVNYQQAVSLVLSAAREYFNASSSLTDPCMELAKLCLKLIQDNHPDIEMELDLITAVGMLNDFNVKILPLQVRLCNDRLQLVDQVLQTSSSAYRQPQKLLKLAHLMRVSGDDKYAREGRILTLAANAALKKEDYSACYQLCQQIIQGGHNVGWEVCMHLGQCEHFTDMESKCQLLSYAVIHCNADQIEHLVRCCCVLETRILQKKLRLQMDSSDADTIADNLSSANSDVSNETWNNPLRQTRELTQRMFQATTQATKEVFMTGHNFWAQTIGWIKPLRQLSRAEEYTDDTINNNNFENQGCHAFYLSLGGRRYVSQLGIDYKHYGTPLENRPALEFSQSLLRAALLTENVVQGEQQYLNPTVLLQLAQDTLPEDCALGLAYLLALKKPSEAVTCFDSLPKSDISLNLACYYFALQVVILSSEVRNKLAFYQSSLYWTHPDVLIQQAFKEVEIAIGDTSSDIELIRCATLLKQNYDTLMDLRQGQLLHRLDRGVDIVRFSTDPQYKRETILGLVMTLDDEVYNTAITLAERYDIPLNQVYINHVEYLFSETELSTRDIETRVNQLNLITELRKRPEEISHRFFTHVYPTISGTDHARLLYYYQLLDKCSSQGSYEIISFQSQIRLLKKIKVIAPGLNFKKLIDSADPLAIISPMLTSNNVSQFAKLASQLTGGDGPLNQSRIYCVWARKVFHSGGDQISKRLPVTDAEWIQRYELCRELLQKLQPRDLVEFVGGAIFCREMLTRIPLDARKEIAKRILKYANLESTKPQRAYEKVEWEKCMVMLKGAISHLDWKSSDLVQQMIDTKDDVLLTYIEDLDLTMSKAEEVTKVLVRCVMDGESLDVLQHLVSISPPSICITPGEIVNGALRCVVEQFRNSPVTEDNANYPPFQCLRTIVRQIHEHLEEGGELVVVDDVLSILRLLCSDPTIPVHIRLDVLQELEEAFTLEIEDASLILLYRTQVITAAAWPDFTVESQHVDSDDERQTLFNKLFDDCHSLQQIVTLTKLVVIWPPMPDSSSKNLEEQPIVRLLVKTLACDEKNSMEEFLSFFRQWPKNVQRLSIESLKHLITKIPVADSLIYLLKFTLLTSRPELHDVATQQINNKEELSPDDFDDEVLRLLLSNGLASKVVSSKIYASLVQYILNCQHQQSDHNDDGDDDDDVNSIPDFLKVETVAKELRNAGHQAEAGSLFMQHRSIPPSLLTFRNALDVCNRWFK